MASALVNAFTKGNWCSWIHPKIRVDSCASHQAALHKRLARGRREKPTEGALWGPEVTLNTRRSERATGKSHDWQSSWKHSSFPTADLTAHVYKKQCPSKPASVWEWTPAGGWNPSGEILWSQVWPFFLFLFNNVTPQAHFKNNGVIYNRKSQILRLLAFLVSDPKTTETASLAHRRPFLTRPALKSTSQLGLIV